MSPGFEPSCSAAPTQTEYARTWLGLTLTCAHANKVAMRKTSHGMPASHSVLSATESHRVRATEQLSTEKPPVRIPPACLFKTAHMFFSHDSISLKSLPRAWDDVRQIIWMKTDFLEIGRFECWRFGDFTTSQANLSIIH